MKRKIILCLLIVFMATISGNVYADEQTNISYVETVENFVETQNDNISFRKCTENDNLCLLVDYNNGILGLENKKTGYIWYSSPPDTANDETATELIKKEILSSNVLRYGIPEKRNNNNYLRSNTGDCMIAVKDIENGVRIFYKYSAGFEFHVDYILENDHLSALLNTEEIAETDPQNIATEITLLGSFGAGSTDENGYFLIPDGSGAIVKFNSNRTTDTNAYSQKVYGNNITAVPTTKSNDTEQIYLSMFGIVKENNAMLVIADKGDADAYINTKISGQSNSSYNLCRFVFTLRNTDTFYMSGNNTDKFTVFEQGNIKTGDIEIKYYPILKESESYIDIAERYREYLIEKGTSRKTDSSLYLNIYGGAEKKKSILGVPFTVNKSFTDYSQTLEILSYFYNSGIENMTVSYKNWTENGIENKIDKKAEPSGTLGGKSSFKKLTDFIEKNNISFYPSTDNRDFVSGNGYNSFSSTCIRASGAYSRIVSYDLAYGIPDGFSKNKSLLSPVYFEEVYKKTAESYKSADFSGISPAFLTTSLYGDYGKNNVSRFKAKELTENALEKISENLDILADNANAYSLPYVSKIKNMPLKSSGFDIFSEDVPFYQIVIHGLVPYSSLPINSSPNPTDTLLMSVATGSLPCYDLIYEDTKELKDTEFNIYYYAGYSGWAEYISEKYNLLKDVYENISESTITGYEQGGNIITTSYSNGTVIKTDFENKTVNFNGIIINLSEGGKNIAE